MNKPLLSFLSQRETMAKHSMLRGQNFIANLPDYMDVILYFRIWERFDYA
jgi:hypothetical protein